MQSPARLLFMNNDNAIHLRRTFCSANGRSPGVGEERINLSRRYLHVLTARSVDYRPWGLGVKVVECT